MKYAVWCYRHSSHHVSNAVCVAFYESLGGNLRVISAATDMIPNDVRAGMWELWEHMLSEREFDSLRSALGR